MYEILAGKQRSLVFPVLCNGYATIDYSDNVADTSGDASTTDDIAYGIWDHEGGFTFEATVTPYEINGYGTHSSLSAPSYTHHKKAMPALSQSVYDAGNDNQFQSELYLSRTARLTHEMMLFYNTNFQISLLNATLHNENQPAEYKIQVRLKLGSTTETFTSPKVILPSLTQQYFYTTGNHLEGFNGQGRFSHSKRGTISGHSGATFTVNVASSLFGGDKQEIFIRDGFNFTSLGTINSVVSNTVTLTNSYSPTIPDGTAFFLVAKRNATYAENFYHIACAYNDVSQTLKIYLNNREVFSGSHTQTDTFVFSKEDFFIGANGSGATGAGSATTNKQFMGEIHELAVSNTQRRNFNTSLNNLLPNYDNTLLYLRFEEVDL